MSSLSETNRVCRENYMASKLAGIQRLICVIAASSGENLFKIV